MAKNRINLYVCFCGVCVGKSAFQDSGLGREDVMSTQQVLANPSASWPPEMRIEATVDHETTGQKFIVFILFSRPLADGLIMAPLASDPQQVLLVLNLAKRKALYQVIDDITRWMRSQVELSVNAEGVTPLHLALRNEGLAHFDAWRRELLAKLKELLSAPDDAKVVEERRKRTERMARERVESPAAGENLIDFSDPSSGMGSGRDVATRKAERAAAVTRLQALYHPVPTRLTTIPLRDREETLSCVLLLLLSTGKYSAESRTLLVYLSSTLELPLEILDTEEVEVATALAAANTDNRHGMSADVEAEKRKQDGQTGRYWKVGLASVAGAALIGVTGGLAAPVVAGAIGGIMGSVGLGGVASFLGIFWMNGALVGKHKSKPLDRRRDG